jgi:hypothetical protein
MPTAGHVPNGGAHSAHPFRSRRDPTGAVGVAVPAGSSRRDPTGAVPHRSGREREIHRRGVPPWGTSSRIHAGVGRKWKAGVNDRGRRRGPSCDRRSAVLKSEKRGRRRLNCATAAARVHRPSETILHKHAMYGLWLWVAMTVATWLRGAMAAATPAARPKRGAASTQARAPRFDLHRPHPRAAAARQRTSGSARMGAGPPAFYQRAGPLFPNQIRVRAELAEQNSRTSFLELVPVHRPPLSWSLYTGLH